MQVKYIVKRKGLKYQKLAHNIKKKHWLCKKECDLRQFNEKQRKPLDKNQN